MDNKFSKDEIILIIIFVITGGFSFFIADVIHTRTRNVFMLMVLIEFGIYCIVKWFAIREKEKDAPTINNDEDNTLLYNQMKERFDKICNYCKQLEDADYDNYDIFPPLTNHEIADWEERNQVTLPESYKQWLLLCNGFDDIGNSRLYDLEGICKYEDFSEEYPDEEDNNYYIVGSYIGDGSLVLIDKDGNFYLLDHAFGLEKSTFESFIDNEVIFYLEDAMKGEGLL